MDENVVYNHVSCHHLWRVWG